MKSERASRPEDRGSNLARKRRSLDHESNGQAVAEISVRRQVHTGAGELRLAPSDETETDQLHPQGEFSTTNMGKVNQH